MKVHSPSRKSTKPEDQSINEESESSKQDVNDIGKSHLNIDYDSDNSEEGNKDEGNHVRDGSSKFSDNSEMLMNIDNKSDVSEEDNNEEGNKESDDGINTSTNKERPSPNMIVKYEMPDGKCYTAQVLSRQPKRSEKYGNWINIKVNTILYD